MTVTFPDPGKNRRWSVAKREIPYYLYAASSLRPYREFPYKVVLEEMTYRNMFGRETWSMLEVTWVKDLETDTLLKAAEVVLERVAKSDWEKSRLGTYPPKTLEK